MIDVSRHEDVFNPTKWGEKRVDVIGVGATGSKVALSLAKLGVRNLHIWDDDVVEEHNLANQAYNLAALDLPKTLALSDIIQQATNTRPSRHGRWSNQRNLGEVVFMMADSMAARKGLFEAIKMNPNVRLVVDSRMGSDQAYLFSYQPGIQETLKSYEGTLFDDDDAHVEVSACGTTISVGPTSDIISGMATWAFIRHAVEGEFYPALGVNARQPFAGQI